MCVIKDADGSVAGCHDSRTDAIKQQRALYANESRMASMYDELDALPDEVAEEEEPVSPVNIHGTKELVKVVVGNDNEALTASLIDRMDAMAQREAQTQQALVAALHAIGTRSPVVNVEAPNVDVAAPNVTVEQPAITVESPSITVEQPEITIQAPNVSVSPEIVLPAAKKQITFERDPLTGELSKAAVTEA